MSSSKALQKTGARIILMSGIPLAIIITMVTNGMDSLWGIHLYLFFGCMGFFLILGAILVATEVLKGFLRK